MRRTKEEAEQTRLKIIAAALDLFSRNGYSNTTLAMIAEAAGFSRGPIYWHFKNKDELYEAVLGYSQGPLQQLVADSEALGEQPLDAVQHFIDQWFRLLLTNKWHRQSFEIFLNKTELTAEMATTLKRERQLTRQLVGFLATQISAAQTRSQLPAGLPAEPLALMVYSSLMGLTHTWLFSPKLFSLKEQAGFFGERIMALLRSD